MRRQPRTIKTASDLARALGISRAVVCYHRKKADAPKTLDVDQWQAYLDTAQQARIPVAFTKEQKAKAAGLKLRLLAASVEKSERENQVRSGQMVEKQFVQQMLQRGTHLLGATLTRVLCSEMPPELSGLPAAAIEAKLRAAVSRAFDEFKAGVAEWK